MIANACAKLNLALAVTGIRSDGYHLLDSIFCTIDLCDTLSMESSSQDLVFSCSDASLLGPDNLVLRAASLFTQKSGMPLSLRIHLDKHIPVMAGLGGGSADAAAALLAFNKLYPSLDDAALFDLAIKLGADVPYMLKGGFQRARGIGEILTPLPVKTQLHFVVMKPEAGLSTPAVFSAYDKAPGACQPDVEAAACALLSGDLPAFARNAGNVLQQSAQALCPVIASLCDALESQGALYASMTGTGSAVFGIFSDENSARRAQQALHGTVPFCACARSV